MQILNVNYLKTLGFPTRLPLNANIYLQIYPEDLSKVTDGMSFVLLQYKSRLQSCAL